MTPVVELFSIHPQIEFCVAGEGVIDACLVSVGLTAGVCVTVETGVEGCLASVWVGMTAAGFEEMLQPSTIRVSRQMIILIELFRDMVTSTSIWR